MEEPITRLRCPYDAGWCPVVAAVPDGNGFTVLYSWCAYCQLLSVDAVDDKSGESHPGAWFGYDLDSRRYFPWREQPTDQQTRWHEFAVNHLPPAERLARRGNTDPAGPNIYPTDG